MGVAGGGHMRVWYLRHAGRAHLLDIQVGVP